MSLLMRVLARSMESLLPEDPWRYFIRTPYTKFYPLDSLVTIRARESGIAHAREHMEKAYRGVGGRRKPISLRDNFDGTYTVLDGNSTVANARDNHWARIPGELAD